MGDRLVIIDGNSLINRAYYAMQRPMITKEGIYTQGIFGFLNMLGKIMDDYDPDYMAVAWDKKRLRSGIRRTLTTRPAGRKCLRNLLWSYL